MGNTQPGRPNYAGWTTNVGWLTTHSTDISQVVGQAHDPVTQLDSRTGLTEDGGGSEDCAARNLTLIGLLDEILTDPDTL